MWVCPSMYQNGRGRSLVSSMFALAAILSIGCLNGGVAGTRATVSVPFLNGTDVPAIVFGPWARDRRRRAAIEDDAECLEFGGTFYLAAAIDACSEVVGRINALLTVCGLDQNVISCFETGAVPDHGIMKYTGSEVAAYSDGVNKIINEIRQAPGSWYNMGDFSYTLSGLMVHQDTEEACKKDAASLNKAIHNDADGIFINCEVTSPSTTATSTVTTSVSSTVTSSLTSSATTSRSSTATSSLTSTRTSSFTTTATSSLTSTGSSTVTSTVTTETHAKFACADSSKTIGVVDGKNCEEQVDLLNELVKFCSGEAGGFSCKDTTDAAKKVLSTSGACTDELEALNKMYGQISKYPGTDTGFKCGIEGLESTDTGKACDTVATNLNKAIDSFLEDSFFNCEVTSPTTTQTSTHSSTVTTSQSSSATTSQSSTATTSQTTSATTSQSSTGTTSATSSVSTSGTSSVTTTQTTTPFGRMSCVELQDNFYLTADNCETNLPRFKSLLKVCNPDKDVAIKCAQVAGVTLLVDTTCKGAALLNDLIREWTGPPGVIGKVGCILGGYFLMKDEATCKQEAESLNGALNDHMDGDMINCQVTTITTTATSSLTSTATSSLTTTATSSLTTTQSSSVTTSGSSTVTTSLSSTATTSVSSSATSTGSTTASSTVSSSVTSSATSSVTTSVTSTVTTAKDGKFECADGKHIVVTNGRNCDGEAAALNELLELCIGSRPSFGCVSTSDKKINQLAPAKDKCKDEIGHLNKMHSEISKFPRVDVGYKCGDSDTLETVGKCADVVALLNEAISERSEGGFINCQVTTVSSTATSSATSTQSTTVSSSVSSTATSSQTSSLTSTQSSTGTSTVSTSVTSTVSSSQTSSVSSTVTSTETSSQTSTGSSTGSSTVSSTASSTQTSSQTSSVSSTVSSSITTTATSTVTTALVGRLECYENNKDHYISVSQDCDRMANAANDLIKACTGKGGNIKCVDVSKRNTLADAKTCSDSAKTLSSVYTEWTGPNGKAAKIECSIQGALYIASSTSCTDFAKEMNDALEAQLAGTFHNCEITTHSSTASSTQSSTASSTVSTTGSSSASSSITTTASTSQTSSVSSTVSSTATTSATTTVTTAEVGKFGCLKDADGKATLLGTALTQHCTRQVKAFNAMLKTCGDKNGDFECVEVSGGMLIKSENCKDYLTAASKIHQIATFYHSNDFACSSDGYLQDKTACSNGAKALSKASTAYYLGDFEECDITSPSTTYTTTASSSATSSASTTATTSATSSATTSATTTQSSSLTTTQTSSATTSASTSVSSSQTTSLSTTASSTVTTSQSTTVTTFVPGRMQCTEVFGDYFLAVDESEDCEEQIKFFDELLQTCGVDKGSVVCGTLESGEVLVKAKSQGTCAATVKVLNKMVDIHSFYKESIFKCVTGGYIRENKRCDKSVASLNAAMDNYVDGTFTTCEKSTQTSTQTSSVSSTATTSQTSSATTSLSSTATTSGSSTVSSTVTSTATSSASSTVSSSATSSQSSSATSTASNSQSTTVTSTATTSFTTTFTAVSTVTTTATSTQTSSQSTTATTSQSSTGTSSVSSSATSSHSTTVSSTGTTTVTSSASSTQSSSVSTTASSTASSSISSTVTTSASTSATSTMTSSLLGRLTAVKDDGGGYLIGTLSGSDCDRQVAALNNLMATCATREKTTTPVGKCGSDGTLRIADSSQCTAAAKLLHRIMHEYDTLIDSTDIFACEKDAITVKASANVDSMEALNRGTQESADGILFVCDRSTQTSTVSSTVTSTVTTSQSSSISSTATSTVTTGIPGRIGCGKYNDDYFLTSDDSVCTEQVGILNDLLKICTGKQGSLECTKVGSLQVLRTSDPDDCTDIAKALNIKIIKELDGPSAGVAGSLKCMLGGILRDNTDCDRSVGYLNDGIAQKEDTFRTCQITTQTSTATSSQTTTATTSLSSTATTSVSSTAISTVTTTATTSVTTTISSTVSTSITSTASSTQSTSASTTVSSTSATTTRTSTGTSTQSSTQTTSASTTVTTHHAGRFICQVGNGVSYLTVDTSASTCDIQLSTLNDLMKECGGDAQPFKCNVIRKLSIVQDPSEKCADSVKAVNEMLKVHSHYRKGEFTCDFLGHMRADKAETCKVGASDLNQATFAFARGDFVGCAKSSQTTTVSSTQTSSATSSATSTATTSASSSATSTQSSTATSSGSTSGSSTATTTRSSTATTSVSSTASSSQSSTATTTITGSAASSVTTTASSTATSSQSSTATSSVSSSATTSVSSTVTSTVSSTASTSISSTASTSATTSQSSTVTTSRTSTATASQSSTATTSYTSTATSSQSSTPTSTVTGSVATTVTTTATSSATTSQSSSATTSQSSTATTSVSSTATSSISSTATTSVSSSATTSLTSTASTTVSSSATTSLTSTVTTQQEGKVKCVSIDGVDYVAAESIGVCTSQTAAIKAMIDACDEEHNLKSGPSFACTTVGDHSVLQANPKTGDCTERLSNLLAVFSGPNGDDALVSCGTDGLVAAKAGACKATVAIMNDAIASYASGEFIDCDVTTQTTTQTSSVSTTATTSATSSATTSATTSASTTASSTASSTESTTQSTTQTSSATTSASSSATTSLTSTASTSETTSQTTTGTTAPFGKFACTKIGATNYLTVIGSTKDCDDQTEDINSMISDCTDATLEDVTCSLIQGKNFLKYAGSKCIDTVNLLAKAVKEHSFYYDAKFSCTLEGFVTVSTDCDATMTKLNEVFVAQLQGTFHGCERTSPSTTATSTASTTVSTSVSSTQSNTGSSTASSTATTTQSNSQSTTVSSTATTTQSNSQSTTLTSTATTSQSSTGTSTVSSTATTSETSTATTSASSSATTSQSSSATTSQSTTVTSVVYGRFVCQKYRNDWFLTVPYNTAVCTEQMEIVTEMVDGCPGGVGNKLECEEVGGMILPYDREGCETSATTMNYMLGQLSRSAGQSSGAEGDIKCSISGHLRDASDCKASADLLNKGIDNYVSGLFINCQITTPTTTLTTTATSTQSSTGTNTATTATSTETSTATSSMTTTASTSETTTASTSVSSTDSSTQSTSQSSTVTTTVSTSETTTATSTPVTRAFGILSCAKYGGKAYLASRSDDECSSQVPNVDGLANSCASGLSESVAACKSVGNFHALKSKTALTCAANAKALDAAVAVIGAAKGISHGTFACHGSEGYFVIDGDCEATIELLNNAILRYKSDELRSCELTTVTSTATSSVSSTASSTQSSSATTSKSTTATSSASSSATTSVTTSATTSATSSQTSTASTSLTSSATSSATTTASTSATTSVSSTQSTSASSTVSSTATTSVTTTGTSTEFSRLECLPLSFEDDKGPSTVVVASDHCDAQIVPLINLLEECSGTKNSVQCLAHSLTFSKVAAKDQTCKELVKEINSMILQATGPNGVSGKFECKDGENQIHFDSLAACKSEVATFADAIHAFKKGRLLNCDVTSPSTTATSTASSSVSSTATTSASSTGTTSATTSASSSVTSSATSSASSTVSSTVTTSVTSTVTTGLRSRFSAYTFAGQDYLSVGAEHPCEAQWDLLTSTFKLCSIDVPNPTCPDTSAGLPFQGVVHNSKCSDIVKAFNALLFEYSGPHGTAGAFDCTFDGFVICKNCDAESKRLNEMIDHASSGDYHGCEQTSPSTTATSTVTSTATSSLTSSASSTVTTTASTTATRTGSSTATTTVTTHLQGRLECKTYAGDGYVAVIDDDFCDDQTGVLNSLLKECADLDAELTCSKNKGGKFTSLREQSSCDKAATGLNTMIDTYNSIHAKNSKSDLECAVGGILVSKGGCSGVTVDSLSELVSAATEGSFAQCGYTTESSTPSTTATSTRSSTATTSASVTASTTLTTTATSTVTTKFLASFECTALSGSTYITCPSGKCLFQLPVIDLLLKECTSTTSDNLKCHSLNNGVSVFRESSYSLCNKMAANLHLAVAKFIKFGSGKLGKMTCSAGGYLLADDDCEDTVESLTRAASAMEAGDFNGCALSTATTTATSTASSTATASATSSATTSVSSTPSSTMTSTAESSVTTTATSSASTTASSSATSTQSTTVSSTGTSTASTSQSSTGSTTVTSTPSSTISVSDATTVTTTASTTQSNTGSSTITTTATSTATSTASSTPTTTTTKSTTTVTSTTVTSTTVSSTTVSSTTTTVTSTTGTTTTASTTTVSTTTTTTFTNTTTTTTISTTTLSTTTLSTTTTATVTTTTSTTTINPTVVEIFIYADYDTADLDAVKAATVTELATKAGLPIDAFLGVDVVRGSIRILVTLKNAKFANMASTVLQNKDFGIMIGGEYFAGVSLDDTTTTTTTASTTTASTTTSTTTISSTTVSSTTTTTSTLTTSTTTTFTNTSTTTLTTTTTVTTTVTSTPTSTVTTTPITVPATLAPAAVQDKSNEKNIIEFILNVAANADIATGDQMVFQPLAFKEGMKKLVCYYGNDKNGERYLINYADCAAKLKITIAEIIPYDDVMKSVLKPRLPDSGRSRRAGGPQTLVRFYVYELPLNSDNMIVGEEIVQANVRAPATFIEGEFGYAIEDTWTVATRNQPSSSLNDDGTDDADVAEVESSDPNTMLWGIVVGVLAIAMFALVGVVLLSQRSKKSSQPIITWDKAFSDSGSLAGINDWDGVARALADHGLDSGSGWGGDGGMGGGGTGYERVLGLLSGAASIAPSTNYLDVTRKDLRPGSIASHYRPPSMTSHYDADLSAHYAAAVNASRSVSPAFGAAVAAHSAANHDDNGRSEVDDGYLALDSEELNAPVFTGLGGGAASLPAQPPDAKLDNLLAMKAACDSQLQEMTAKQGDNFDDATRQMLAFTQQSLNMQVNEHRKSQSPDIAELPPIEVSPDGGGGHYYPTQTAFGVEPIVSAATVSVQASSAKMNTGIGLKLPRGPTHFVPGESINERPTLSADNEFTATINGLGSN